MSLAWIPVGALVLAVTLSGTTTVNVGIMPLAIAVAGAALSWILFG